MIRAIAVALACTLSGCGSVQAVGFWVQRDAVNESFSLTWYRDTDPRYRTPDPDVPTVGVPRWLVPPRPAVPAY